MPSNCLKLSTDHAAANTEINVSKLRAELYMLTDITKTVTDYTACAESTHYYATTINQFHAIQR